MDVQAWSCPSLLYSKPPAESDNVKSSLLMFLIFSKPTTQNQQAFVFTQCFTTYILLHKEQVTLKDRGEVSDLQDCTHLLRSHSLSIVRQEDRSAGLD